MPEKYKNKRKRGSPIPLPMPKLKCQVDDQVRKMQKTGASEVATNFSTYDEAEMRKSKPSPKNTKTCGSGVRP